MTLFHKNLQRSNPEPYSVQVNHLWKVKCKYNEGTYESFHLQKRYENELEVEFLFQIHC